MAQGKEHIPTEETRRLVEELAGYGLPYENIGALLPDRINRETLTIHYRDELDRGKAEANAAVGKSLFHRAINDESPTAAIWWSKTQMKWKEEKEPEKEVDSGKKFIINFVDANDSTD